MSCPWLGCIGACLAALVALPSCAGGESDTVHLGRRNGAADATTMEARTARGRVRFVRRIDSDVQEVFRADLGRGAPEWIAMTGAVSGAEQGSVLRIAADGSLLGRYRVDGATPWGAQLQVPMLGRSFAVRMGGRPLLVVTTAGNWAPSAIEILEARPDGGLVPRLRFWNAGTIDSVAASGHRIAFVGLNNAVGRAKKMDYPVVAGVFDATPTEGATPVPRVLRGYVPEDPGVGYLRYFLLPETHGHAHEQMLPVETDGIIIRVRFDSGLSYVLGADSGTAAVEASADFRAEYAERRSADPSLPEIEVRLKELAASVEVVSPP